MCFRSKNNMMKDKSVPGLIQTIASSNNSKIASHPDRAIIENGESRKDIRNREMRSVRERCLGEGAM